MDHVEPLDTTTWFHLLAHCQTAKTKIGTVNIFLKGTGRYSTNKFKKQNQGLNQERDISSGDVRNMESKSKARITKEENKRVKSKKQT